MQINKLITGLALTLSPLFFLGTEINKNNREYYQITVYRFRDTTQERIIDQYLQSAYLPALHKKGINSIGVFKPIANDTAAVKMVYILIPFRSLEKVRDLPVEIIKDKDYLNAGKEYLDGSTKNPPYLRIENILLYSFPLAPVMQLPKLSSSRNDRIYELRSYESATEKLNISKVKMFNEGGEIALFKQLEFNAIFYAEVISGSHMPNLMYITSFENREQRETHWKNFSESDVWKKLKSMPEYQDNVSKAEIILMKATSYSDY
jgi:hypothetical protein